MRSLIVAKKEFSDIVTSKRFIALLAAMVIFFLMSVLQTLSTTSGGRMSMTPVISFFGGSVAFIGGIFGIALGFDLITKEKETGTLRTLLTRPVFRDEVIIGKGIAAFLAICVAVGITSLFMLGALTLYYTPSSEELSKLAKMMLVTIAYLYTFFSIAFLISAIVKSSSTALTIAIGVFIVLALLLPLFSNYIAQVIVGSPPESPIGIEIGRNIGNITDDPRIRSYMEEMRNYREKVQSITSTLSIFSPVSSYSTILNSLTASGYFRTLDITKNLLSFIIIPVVLFALAYVRFTREEL
ncbi:MAG: ABC transporter permease [Archaeoglobales archaeon]|nr:ABC transporter permease [Archaeoglobales archaeon]